MITRQQFHSIRQKGIEFTTHVFGMGMIEIITYDDFVIKMTEKLDGYNAYKHGVTDKQFSDWELHCCGQICEGKKANGKRCGVTIPVWRDARTFVKGKSDRCLLHGGVKCE